MQSNRILPLLLDFYFPETEKTPSVKQTMLPAGLILFKESVAHHTGYLTRKLIDFYSIKPENRAWM